MFKVHLSNIYRAINLDLPPYLQDLWTTLPYLTAASAIIEPMIDGIALPGEWDGAACYDAPVSGNLDIESFHFGYDASVVFLRVDALTLDDSQRNRPRILRFTRSRGLLHATQRSEL